MDKLYQYKYFNCEDFFMLRCPLLSADDYVDLFCEDIEKTSQKVFSIIENNTVVREAILISSNSLYRDIINIKNIKDTKKIDQILKSVIKYLIRMSTRTTPYGITAGVDIGCFENKIDINLKNNTEHIKRARVDMEWLYKVLYILENNKNH